MHPFDWQLLKSAYLIQDQWLSLRADTCPLPNGHPIAPYYVLEYSPWVNIVALTREHQVVLVRQYPAWFWVDAAVRPSTAPCRGG